MAPSRHDWKIVDWDVKPQHNQPTNQLILLNDETHRIEYTFFYDLTYCELFIWNKKLFRL